MTSTKRMRRILGAIGAIFAAIALLIGTAGPTAFASGSDQTAQATARDQADVGAAQQADANDPTAVADPKIIGGNAPTQNYPSGAKLSFQYDAPAHDRFDWHTCGGFAPFGRYLVTAAHCVTDPPPGSTSYELEQYAHHYHTDLTSLAIPTADKQFKIRVGNNDRTAGRLVKVARIVAVHPLWKWDLAGTPGEQAADVALIELEEYLDDVDLLPLSVRDPRAGDTVYRLGWGITDPDGQGPLPINIRELKSQIKNKAACEPGDVLGWSVGDICVGDFPGYEDDGACSGDSGGPAMLFQDNRWVAAGITSRGTGDLCGVVPESYTSMAFYKKWIYDTARNAPQIPAQRKPSDPVYTATPVPVAGS